MKTSYRLFVNTILGIFFLFNYANLRAQDLDENIQFKQYSGIVKDKETNKALVSAVLLIKGENISTITNIEGRFTIKIPDNMKQSHLVVSMLGYKDKLIPVASLLPKKNKIKLEPAIIKLDEVIVNTLKDARNLVKTVFDKRKDNYFDKHVLMTAFYRESIKRNRRNVSLAEAIVNIYKQPYMTYAKDKILLQKARKSTDYTKLDTIAFKLQGGPFNALFVDVMKYPEYIFYPDGFDLYDFKFLTSTSLKGKSVYVVSFKQKPGLNRPLYFGKLFIDIKSKALVSALYHLNVEDKVKSAKLFVKSKPRDVFAYPVSVFYRVNYREKEGKWYYAYGNSQLTFKIKRKGKWFQTKYSLNSEMAVTDWVENPNKDKPSYKQRMKHNIIIGDEASGFSDPEYWGAFNVIEPDKSIESAIKKIKKHLIKE